MYSKDELLSKDISELEHIAKDLDAVFNAGDDKEKLAYSILDKQAEEEGSSHPLTGLRRKRTRIAKREDRVYSVKGTDGENFDVMKNQVTGPGVKEQPLFKDEPALSKEQPEEAKAEAPVVFPKHRGRKSKAELAAIAAAEAAAKEKETAVEEQHPETPAADVKAVAAEDEKADKSAADFIPEAEFATGSQTEAQPDNDLLAKLQEKSTPIMRWPRKSLIPQPPVCGKVIPMMGPILSPSSTCLSKTRVPCRPTTCSTDP